MSVLSVSEFLHTFSRERANPVFQRLSRRKATVFFLTFIAAGCILACCHFPARLTVLLFAGSFAIAVLLLACRKRFWYAVFLPLLTGFLLASCNSILLFDGYVGYFQKLAAEQTVLSVRCVVTEVVYTNAYSGRYVCRVLDGKVPWYVVVASENPDFTTGQVLTGEICLLPWEETDDSFDEERYYLTKGVAAAAEDQTLWETGETRQSLTGIFQTWNRRLSARISAHVRNDGLPLAMLLGNRSALEDAVKRDFRRLGILHLLAVSGTHFSILTSIAERFMIHLRLRPAHRYWILALLTVLYMFLTGLSASVRRAGLMFLLALLCRGLGLKVRYFSSLNIACGLILLFDPFAVLDMGLHLSYLAVCGCILTIQVEKNWPGLHKLMRLPVSFDREGKRIPAPKGWRRFLSPRWLGGRVLSMLLLNLIVTSLTFPLSWLYFGEMSFAALLVNLIYIPLTGVMLVLTLLYLVLYPLRIAVLPMAVLVSGVAELLEAPASLLAAIPHISVSLQYPFIPIFMLPIVCSVCVLPLLRRKLRGIAVVLSLLLLMNGSILLYDHSLQDQTIAVYRNDRVKDGFVIRSGGKILLMDISDGSKSFTKQLLTEASALYATELDGYMVTHYHNRHVSTLQYLAENWILRFLYLPQPITEEEEAVFQSLVSAAAEYGIETILFDDSVPFGQSEIQLAARTYISRSTHPITGMILRVDRESLAYVSSSVSQGDPTMQTALAKADVGIFGAHSPVYKKTFDLPLEEVPKIFVWNGDAPYYYEGILPAAGVELYDCSRFSYCFVNQTDGEETESAPAGIP